MCWNASISINTYLFGVFASSLAYINNHFDIYFLLFYHSFITMQLLEYFIWSRTFSNELLCKIAYILVFSQPIFAIFSVKINNVDIRNLLLILYSFYLLFLWIIFPISKTDFSTNVSKNGHLIWNWVPSIWFIYIWLLFLVIPFFISKYYHVFLFLLVSFFVTYFIYYKDRTWGSLWCWIANISSFYVILCVFWKDLCVKW